MFYCVYIFRVFFSMSNPKKETPFELKTEENTQFSNKCKDIFGNLEKFERKHEEYNKSRSDDKDEGMQKSDPGDMDTETITSAFKTPCQPKREEGQSWRSHHDRSQNRDDGPPPWRKHRADARGSSSIQRELQPKQFGDRRGGHPYYRNRGNRIQRTPDYKTNPGKWTKYSLEDVGNEDMSESSNTRAAFAFLEERRKLREGEMKIEAVNTDDTSCSKGIFTFKKPVKNDCKTEKKLMSSKVGIQLPDSKEEEQEENVMSEEMTEKVPEKVSFKSLKKSKRSIRSRETEDD